jgi:NhaP-type Na+/H+ and K+/H+ antiporter
VAPGSKLHGFYLAELRLPMGSTPGLLARDGRTLTPTSETRLREGDVLVVFTAPDKREAAERRIRSAVAWRSGEATTDAELG